LLDASAGRWPTIPLDAPRALVASVLRVSALANPDRGLPLPPDPELTLPEDGRRRAELTISCRDADSIPKVRDAGTVRVENGIAIQGVRL
jgi:hypothetical protein